MLVELLKDRMTFVDYTFVREGEDIIFDKELSMESMRFYEGKSFKVTLVDGAICLKWYEDWDGMPDINEVDWMQTGGSIPEIDWKKESKELMDEQDEIYEKQQPGSKV